MANFNKKLRSSVNGEFQKKPRTAEASGKALEAALARGTTAKSETDKAVAQAQRDRQLERDRRNLLARLYHGEVAGAAFAEAGKWVGTDGTETLRKALANAAGITLAPRGMFYITRFDRTLMSVAFDAEIVEGRAPKEDEDVEIEDDDFIPFGDEDASPAADA